MVREVRWGVVSIHKNVTDRTGDIFPPNKTLGAFDITFQESGFIEVYLVESPKAWYRSRVGAFENIVGVGSSVVRVVEIEGFGRVRNCSAIKRERCEGTGDERLAEREGS